MLSRKIIISLTCVCGLLFCGFVVSIKEDTGLSQATRKPGSIYPGCFCHGDNPSPSTQVWISGPTQLAQGQVGTYTVSVRHDTIIGAGFDVAAFYGTLQASDSVGTWISNSEVVHRLPRLRTTSDTISWTFQYQAPMTNTVDTLYVNGNAVNMNDAPDGDYWNYGTNFIVTVGVLPVELTSFISQPTTQGIRLSWTTATEKNNAGFYIERTTAGNANWQNIGFVKGNGTTTQSHAYGFTDHTASGNVFYRLRQTDYDGKYDYSKTVEVEAAPPKTFTLSQNYPNPFNPSTTISYAVPTPEAVTLKIFDLTGKEVSRPLNGERKPAGTYNVTIDAARLASGVYLYQLQAGRYIETKKMLLIK